MKKVVFPGHSKPASPVILGTMIIGLQNFEASSKLLDNALALGLNTLDMAHVYGGGDTERAVGRYMAERQNREELFLITKGGHPNRDRARITPYDIASDMMDSLARLQTDYIDLYLLHRDDTSQPVGLIIEALNRHKKAGRIRAFGGSNWSYERIAEANAYASAHGLAGMTATSPNFSLCEQVGEPWPGCMSVSGAAGREAREWYAAQGIPIMAYSSLGGGVLSGRVTRENYAELLGQPAINAYAHEVNFARLDRAGELAAHKGLTVPQIGLAYILSQTPPVYPIVGAADGEELRQAVEAAGVALTADECGWLEG